ncbi:MAG: MATE family efflux transporter [Eubacteriaceae bacterium]|jgi:putative MATE family efflux protein|nr:MATE family efflux transporter [Eubacteriaceae bacterium]
MSKANLLTSGNITKQLIALTLPLLLSNIIQQLYNTVDMIIVGRFIDDSAFAAIGVSGTVMNWFIFMIVGLCTGFSMIFANRFGAGSGPELKRAISISLIFGGAAAVIFAAAAFPFLRRLLDLMQTPAALTGECISFLRIILFGILLCYLYNFMTCILQSVGKTNVILIFLVISLLLNLSLAVIFVGYCRLGVSGAALATIISQGIAAFLSMIYIRKALPFLKITRTDFVFDRQMMHVTAQYGTICAIQQSGLYIGKMMIQGIANSMGEQAIMGFAAAGVVEVIYFAFTGSTSNALSIFFAQNKGFGNYARINRGMKTALKLLISVCIVLSAAIFLFSHAMISMLISDKNPQAILYGVQYLTWIAGPYLLAAVSDIMQGYFRGCSHMNTAFIVTIIQIGVRVAVSYALPPVLVLRCIAIGTFIGWSAMIAAQIIFYRRYQQETMTSSM